MEKKSYTVKEEGWLDGTYRKAGEQLLLTEQQAQHLLIVGSIELTPAPKATPEKPARQIAALQAPSE